MRDTPLTATLTDSDCDEENASQGTDHGTGTIMVLAGGAVGDGRVIADWPGLRQNQLRDGRDLAATTDMRAVIKGVAVDLLGGSPALLSRDVFPDSEAAAPMKGLIV